MNRYDFYEPDCSIDEPYEGPESWTCDEPGCHQEWTTELYYEPGVRLCDEHYALDQVRFAKEYGDTCCAKCLRERKWLHQDTGEWLCEVHSKTEHLKPTVKK